MWDNILDTPEDSHSVTSALIIVTKPADPPDSSYVKGIVDKIKKHSDIQEVAIFTGPVNALKEKARLLLAKWSEKDVSVVYVHPMVLFTEPVFLNSIEQLTQQLSSAFPEVRLVVTDPLGAQGRLFELILDSVRVKRTLDAELDLESDDIEKDLVTYLKGDEMNFADYFEIICGFHEKLFNALEKVDPKLLKREMPIGWKNIQITTIHMVDALDFWVNTILQGKPQHKYTLKRYPDVKTLRERYNVVKAGMMAFLRTLKPTDLQKEIIAQFEVEITFPLEKALMHIILHDAHHRGQINMLLRMVGETPQEMGLI